MSKVVDVLPDCVRRAIECINTVEPSKRIFQELLNALEHKSHELHYRYNEDATRVLMGIMDLAAGFTNTTSFREGILFSFDYGKARKYLDKRLL